MHALVLALALFSAGPGMWHGERYFRPRANLNPGVALQVLPAGGGQSNVVALCDAVQSSDLVGNWFCLYGDGTTKAGSQSLSPTGAPSSPSTGVCPNGANCGFVSRKRFDGVADFYATGNLASPAGDFSCVIVFRNDTATANYRPLITHATNGNYELQFFSNGGATTVQVDLYKDTVTATTATSPATHVKGAWHAAAFTYDFIADGSSVLTAYLDGAAGAAVSTAVGPMKAETIPYRVFSRAFGPFFSSGEVAGAMCTEKQLSGAAVQQLSTAALGYLSGSGGETLTFTRASSATCEAEDGTLTTLPNNRPCVTRAGLRDDSAGTNSLLRARDLSNASWTKTTMTCAATATGKDGVPNSASTCTATAGNATVLQTVTIAAANRTSSVDLKRRTGSGNIQITRDNGGTWTTLDATNCYSPVDIGTAPNSSTWVRCRLMSSVLNPPIGLRVVTSGDAVDVDYFGDEAGEVPTSRIETIGSTATRAAEVTSLVAPAVLSATEGCVRAGFTPIHTNGAVAPHYMVYSAGNGRPLYGNAAANAGCGDNGQCVAAYDGTHTVGVNAGFVAGTRKYYRTSWSTARNLLKIENVTDGTSTTSAFTTFTFGANLYIGTESSGIGSAGITSDVVVGTSADGCQ